MSPALPTPATVRAWAGTTIRGRHILAVLEVLEDTRTTLGAWRLHVASYRGWSSAGPRTEQERCAVHIGESYRPGKTPRRVFFMIPTEGEQ